MFALTLKLYPVPHKGEFMQICLNLIITKDEQVLLFCIAIQYRSPGISIAILLWKTSNTQEIPENLFDQSTCTAHAGI